MCGSDLDEASFLRLAVSVKLALARWFTFTGPTITESVIVPAVSVLPRDDGVRWPLRSRRGRGKTEVHGT